MKTSEDEIELRVDPVVLADVAMQHKRGDVIELDTPAHKGRFEVLGYDFDASVMRVRPHAKVTSAPKFSNRRERRAAESTARKRVHSS